MLNRLVLRFKDFNNIWLILFLRLVKLGGGEGTAGVQGGMGHKSYNLDIRF